MPIDIIPSADYYDDQDLHGNYQDVTLEDLVNNYIMSGQDDDFTSTVPRHLVLYQARRAFKELYFDAVQEIKGVALELSNTLTVTLPPDFVNYVRISWLGDDGLLRPMATNNKMSIAKDYLQDNDYGILFDNDGCPLVGTDEGIPLDPITGAPIVSTSTVSEQDFNTTIIQFNPNKNFTNVYANGSYIIDKNQGLIKFGSEVFGSIVVLEYISDGLYTGCEGRAEADLRIHKFAEDAVYNWIYWKLIERRRNVPANAKILARKEWFNSRRICKRRMQTIRPDELRQIFKGSNKWIKGI